MSLRERLRACADGGRPIRVGLVGAGQMGVDICSQVTHMPGIDVLAVADVRLERAALAHRTAGKTEFRTVASPEEAASALQEPTRVIADDASVVTSAQGLDVIVESTGVPDAAARTALWAAFAGKHVVTMSVEADVLIGPLLSRYAEHHGVVYTIGAGDEPPAVVELLTFAQDLGFNIVAAGKGKNNPLDRHVMPSDVLEEARRRDLNPAMLVEFIDGSKTMIEMAAVANATGLVPDIRGMHGPSATRDTLHHVFCLKEQGGVLEREGVVDYAVGPVAPGVFVIVSTDDPRLRQAMRLRDMGNGPTYTLFRPYHLCSIEVPLSVARAALDQKADMKPRRRLVAEVMAVAKRDLAEGQVLDRTGGTTHYGLVDRYEVAQELGAVPLGLAEGSTVRRPVKKDEVLTFENVAVAPGLTAQLRHVQTRWTNGELSDDQMVAAVDALARESNPWAVGLGRART